MTTEVTNKTLLGYIAKADAQGNGNGKIDTKEEKEALFDFCDNEMRSMDQQIKDYEEQMPSEEEVRYHYIPDYSSEGSDKGGILGLIAGGAVGLKLGKGFNKTGLILGGICTILGGAVGLIAGGLCGIIPEKAETNKIYGEFEKELSDMKGERLEFSRQVGALKKEYQSIE